jgi:hypothetical protein
MKKRRNDRGKEEERRNYIRDVDGGEERNNKGENM